MEKLKNEKGPLTWLSKLFNKENEPKEKKPSLYAYVLLVLIIGVGIMIAANSLTSGQKSNSGSNSNQALPAFNDKTSKEDIPAFGRKAPAEIKSINDYEKYLESEIKGALEAISGVDDVKVVVNVDASEQRIFEKNKVTQKQVTEETDRDGGQRTVEDTNIDEQLVLTKSGEKEGPVVLETKKPKIRGVLIVAKGAENIQIKKWIIEAVTRSLDVPSHRVSVMPKK